MTKEEHHINDEWDPQGWLIIYVVAAHSLEMAPEDNANLWGILSCNRLTVTEISFYLNGLSVRDSSIDWYLRHSLLSAGGVWYGGGWGGAGDGDTGTGGHAALLLLHKEPPPACIRSTATVDPSLSPPAEKDRTATMLKASLVKHPYCTQISLFLDVVQLWTTINMPMTYSYSQVFGIDIHI